MPEINLPEVRLKDKLPEGLRDVTMDDIQKAMPDFNLPSIDFGREARKVREATERAAKDVGKQADKAAKSAGKQADKMARDAQKAAGKQAGKVGKAAHDALPRRG